MSLHTSLVDVSSPEGEVRGLSHRVQRKTAAVVCLRSDGETAEAVSRWSPHKAEPTFLFFITAQVFFRLTLRWC